MDNCSKWKPAMMEIMERWHRWRSKQPQKTPRERGLKRTVVNKMGELLGPWDDERSEDSFGGYESDNDFVLDEEDEDYDEDEVDSKNASDDDYEATEGEQPTRQVFGNSKSDNDNESLPSSEGLLHQSKEYKEPSTPIATPSSAPSSTPNARDVEGPRSNTRPVRVPRRMPFI